MIDPEKLQEKVLEAIMEEMDEYDHDKNFGPIEVEITIPADMVEEKPKKKPKKKAEVDEKEEE